MYALVVDDNRALAENVGELLSTLGVEIAIAEDVESGLRLAAELRPDLAVVDLWLPKGSSGVDMIPRLRAAAPGVEIVIVTGSASVESAAAAIRQGVSAYLQKPFDVEDLLAVAGRALEQSRLRRERERLSLELERSEALHRTLVEAVDAAILLVDEQGIVQFANRFAERCSADAKTVVGRSFLDTMIPPDRHTRVVRTLLRVRAGDSVDEMEYDLPLRDVKRTLRWSFRRLADQPPRALAVGVETTEVRSLQQRTVEAEALAAVGQLTSGLAHEIRNPLNAASLQLELMLRGAKKLADADARDRIASSVGIVRTELKRLEQMLDEFLSLARPSGLETAEVDLGSLIAEVVTLNLPIAEQRGVVLRSDVPTGRFTVLADAPRIKQVLINVFANAFDALRGKPHGEILVRAGLRGDMVHVAVDDDGVGLDVETLGDPFQPFATTKEAGTGLGLSIVRKIVERHGGKVGLVRRDPVGATAWFTLPRAHG